MQRHARAQCDTSIALARVVGMREPIQQALAAVCERWDGKGAPAGLAGEAIDPAIRLHHLADGAEIALHRAGPDAARDLVAGRSSRWVDPALATVFSRESRAIFEGLDGPDLWLLFLAEEPEPHGLCDADRATDVARAFAHLADLKSAFTLGHSTTVAALCAGAAAELALSPADTAALERAGLLHDLGRLSVPNSVWDRPGALGFAEWERVRLHTYYTERVLASSSAWKALAPLAAGAHEQPSGRGYHRALDDASISRAGRVLAAADAVAAMREPRAYRPPRSAAEIERELGADVKSGKLDAQAVDAVLAASGQRVSARRPEARSLSDREVEVLRLVARGKTNKEIGVVLGISPRTVQVHVAHVYDKLGVYSRAGAALAAVEAGLLTDSAPA
jgi:HD-GYP domain-containing protein (c-di-GMP phosphodiesterase class II)